MFFFCFFSRAPVLRGKPTHYNSGEASAGTIRERQRWDAFKAEGPWKYRARETWHCLRLGRFGGSGMAYRLCYKWLGALDSSIMTIIDSPGKSLMNSMGADELRMNGFSSIQIGWFSTNKPQQGSLVCRQTTSNWSKTLTPVAPWFPRKVWHETWKSWISIPGSVLKLRSFFQGPMFRATIFHSSPHLRLFHQIPKLIPHGRARGSNRDPNDMSCVVHGCHTGALKKPRWLYSVFAGEKKTNTRCDNLARFRASIRIIHAIARRQKTSRKSQRLRGWSLVMPCRQGAFGCHGLTFARSLTKLKFVRWMNVLRRQGSPLCMFQTWWHSHCNAHVHVHNYQTINHKQLLWCCLWASKTVNSGRLTFDLIKSHEIHHFSTVFPVISRWCYFCRRPICHRSSNSLEVPRSKVAAPSWVYGGQTLSFPNGCDDFDDFDDFW